jgi:hypothetical protein
MGFGGHAFGSQGTIEGRQVVAINVAALALPDRARSTTIGTLRSAELF